MEKNQSSKAQHFFQLHKRSSTFVLPNAWDVISAKVFEESGYEAIGTTSAGIAASLGYQDGQNLPLHKLIETIEAIVRSINIPVSADIEAGYGSTVEEVVETVKKVLTAGAIGVNLEDATGNPKDPIFECTLQMEKIAAIRQFAESQEGAQLFINARTDLYWLDIGDTETRFHQAVTRAKAYQEAGADCIFIPGLNHIGDIQRFRNEISCPINLLASSKMPSLTDLSKVGIERISCGSGPFRATVNLLRAISDEIINEQTFYHMTKDEIPYIDITALMENNSN